LLGLVKVDNAIQILLAGGRQKVYISICLEISMNSLFANCLLFS
jgi:hypothetical protein